MEAWRTVLRTGFLPFMPTKGLLAVQRALASDDPRLVQKATTIPLPMQYVMEWPVEGADFISFVYWQGCETDGSVGSIERAFASACYNADQALGEPASCHWFLNYWDEAEDRHALFSGMLDEVNQELVRRSHPDDDDDQEDEDDSDIGCPVAVECK